MLAQIWGSEENDEVLVVCVFGLASLIIGMPLDQTLIS